MNPALPHLAWFDVPDPASPDLDELARRFGLHELQIEDCRHRPQRPKTEEHDHYIFAVLKHMHDPAELEFDDIDLFLGPDFLISVRSGDAVVFESVRVRVEQEHVDRLDRVFYMIVDKIVDGYQPVLDKLADEISDIEDVVLDRPDPQTLARIFSPNANWWIFAVWPAACGKLSTAWFVARRVCWAMTSTHTSATSTTTSCAQLT